MIEKTPQVGRVKEGEYSYFDYYNTCKNCTLLITANTFSTDKDVDLFVNFGSSKGLPNQNSSDFNSTHWLSETMDINLNSTYFKGKTSMKGLFLIGVYSDTGATF